ncbi:glycosyl hydrolases family 31-domain-containing protein [Cercophora newfieldiana]|uniref:alpha-glucosidase n=1 Tax=Cercophora newfieldiana TaxID=92897 RepID=A0AA39YSS3_9PEZI|nr:glycosyl hydrolases family 31-domain-containing protein [Cercophora newfieldiana]
MSIVERDLTYLVPETDLSTLPPRAAIRSFTLVSGPKTHFPGFKWTLEFFFPQAYRILLTGPERPRPPHDNVNAPSPYLFTILSFDKQKCHAVFAFPSPTTSGLGSVSGIAPNEKLELHVWWAYQLFTEVWQTSPSTGGTDAKPVLRDLQARSYALTEFGVIRHWMLDRSRLHLGLGEKAAPIDLTGRSFTMHATDAALYDAYRTDPLYKHTPFLISTPKATDGKEMGLTYGIFHATNSVATWDVGGEIDYPSGGWSKKFVQHWGGLEEWVMVGRGVEGVVKTFAEMAGKPKLVGRDWLGYLGSTMLLADDENAQHLLEGWPELCEKYNVPCSAMHLSSGFTVDEKTGSRWVFYLNKKRYPNFKGMVEVFHKAGMKIVPNVKPYMLHTHPSYNLVKDGDGLFYDPITKGPSKQNLWSSGMAESGDGSWADFSAPATREWWARGVQGLIDLGVDGMWDDNNEFFTRDDGLLCKNEFDHSREAGLDGKIPTGLMGRVMGTELMNKVSHDVLQAAAPERRPYVLTRSGNPATFKYACSTWSGDNATSWREMRGSQHIQLNSALSLMQSTGADVGGFGGDTPTPELFVRWVQLGVTHSRFCIHSAPSDTRGQPKLNVPWMYPDLLPIIRAQIKWRYCILPFLNNLMWRSHLHAEPSNAPLFYGPFATDPTLYTGNILNGFDAWLGVGQLLIAPQVFEGGLTHRVYFPMESRNDDSWYFDLHAPFGKHKAGTWSTVATPIEHGGLFARQGAVIPVGKDHVTLTAVGGPARTHTDGVRAVLKSEGGQVSYDDWRGVMIFPGDNESTGWGEWIEDDGISADPSTCVVRVAYQVPREEDGEIQVDVTAKYKDSFVPLWMGSIHVLLPVGEKRTVTGAVGKPCGDKMAWVVEVKLDGMVE